MTTTTDVADILEPLTEKQRLYVQARLQGMTRVASAAAAGSPNPKKNAHKFEASESVKTALRKSREVFAQQLAFDRKKAHDMYMTAYHNADTATEQKMVVDSLVKLHGIAEPETKRLQHQHTGVIEHKGQITHLPDAKLLEMARLPPSEDPNVIEGEIVEDEDN